MKKGLIITLILLFVQCSRDYAVPATIEGTNATSNFQLSYLFEFEGVKIYRFYDKEEYRYFSVGNGSILPQKQTRSNGENSSNTWIDGVYTNE